jgi:hypothetical protein
LLRECLLLSLKTIVRAEKEYIRQKLRSELERARIGMGSQEKGIDFKKYILILKNATLAVQIIPFVYSFIYLLILSIYPHVSEPFEEVLDTLFYISPLFMAGILILSKILHLCKWHRTACVLPLFPQIISFIDYYVIELTEVEAYVTDFTISTMAILLLMAAYNVFFK